MLELALWIAGMLHKTEPATVAPPKARVEVTERDRELFDANIAKYLSRDSWNDSLAYLHGHFLMVPLQAAFLMDEEAWISQYEAQFKRFVKVPRDQWCKNPLSRFQYLYVPSRFLALSAMTGRKSDVAPELNKVLTDAVVARWTTEDAIAFDHKPFTGVGERVRHKLSLSNPARSHFKAYTDEEFFIFAVASDLIYVERKTGVKNPKSATLREIVDTAMRVVRAESEFTPQGGWLFQVGGWTDHPDDAYAGYSTYQPGLVPKKKSDVVMDTSHFHRFALYVNSLRNAQEPGSSDAKYMDRVFKGLSKQMADVVLVPPDNSTKFWRTKNFMDGWNGLYRYGAADLGGKGYGPYELSGTFLMGWWSFLDNPKIDKAYAEISQAFPLSQAELQVYQGPVYKPNPTAKSWYENGLAELFTRLAAKMPSIQDDGKQREVSLSKRAK
ncbi:MAG: hypothetical protein KIT11_11610 [Fimbriimonadaceae bacterium]|nr:hypothetical protein [Fimbriimonadaceae bacterium]QYK55320.1 MAG: hypothetical protein KF733_09925 [Fimbriimonadaceae bacterium]